MSHHGERSWHDDHVASLPFGDRVADGVTRFMGSWRFIVIITAFIGAWIGANVVTFLFVGWDPYPFILLNLIFSAHATYSAPLIMMAQNRQAERDRAAAAADHASIGWIVAKLRKEFGDELDVQREPGDQ